MRSSRRALGFAVAVAVALGWSALSPAHAQAPVFRFEPAAAPAEAGAIPLDTGGVPGMAPESWHRLNGDLGVRNVSRATLTPVLPAPGTSTGAAVIVAPGGGFYGLSMQSEGFAEARWLADHGIAAFVLKYRLLPTPADFGLYSRAMTEAMSGRPSELPPPPRTTPPMAQQDGLAALRLVRARSAQFGVDPHRVGMMGFSAGAVLALGTATDAPPAERPDFVAIIYGPTSATAAPAGAPPLFAAVAEDDPLFGRTDFALIKAWRDEGRPVELLYLTSGGHGFGLGRPGTASVGWIDTFRTWAASLGLLGASR